MGSTVTFRNLGDGQQGDTTFDLVFYAGTDPDKAAQAAYSQWNIVFANVPDDGKYGTGLAMVETENGIWMLVKATVEKAGTEDKAEPEPVILQNIAIAQHPTKTKYKDGETFDPTGMKITATYSDGSNKTIAGTFTDVTFSPGTITDGTTSVTVFYGGKQTAVSVECITLDHISVNLTPREYTVDEELISSNVTVKAVYSDTITTETIELDNCSFTLGTTPITLPYKFDTAGDYTLTVTYDDMTSDPVNIHVKDKDGYHEDNGNYVVTEPEGLQKLFAAHPTNDFAGKTITLDKNLAYTVDTTDRPLAETFKGELHGNGATVTITGGIQGLFNEIGTGGKVLNVDIEVSGAINGDDSSSVGAVASENNGTIDYCDVTINDGSNINGGNESTGGVVGKNHKSISNCTVTISGTIIGGIGGSGVGAVAGTNNGEISGCDVTISGTINAAGGTAGGVVGNNTGGGTVTACYSTGTVSGGTYSGGVVGDNTGTVTACYSTGAVTGGDGTGGVVGQNYGGTVTACYSTSAVNGTNADAGGVVGKNLSGGKVTACYSTGNVTGVDAGGVVGYNDSGTVNDCYWSGIVEGGKGIGYPESDDNATKITGEGKDWDALVKAMIDKGYNLEGTWQNPTGLTPIT